MPNKVYYKLIHTDRYLEYHVSSARELAKTGKSMSKRISVDNQFTGLSVAEWLDEIEALGLIPA